jgi:hypothetical protein
LSLKDYPLTAAPRNGFSAAREQPKGLRASPMTLRTSASTGIPAGEESRERAVPALSRRALPLQVSRRPWAAAASQPCSPRPRERAVPSGRKTEHRVSGKRSENLSSPSIRPHDAAGANALPSACPLFPPLMAYDMDRTCASSCASSPAP